MTHGGCQGNGGLNHFRIADAPLQNLHAAYGSPGHGIQPANTEMVDQDLLCPDHVCNGDHGEIKAIGLPCFRIDGAGTGRTTATAQDV